VDTTLNFPSIKLFKNFGFLCGLGNKRHITQSASEWLSQKRVKIANYSI
jgi:hypothetical protein